MQFRDAAGVTVDGVVTEVSATEVLVELGRAEPASVGTLVVPAGRQRLIDVLVPGLG